MIMLWSFEHTGYRSGEFNMQYDERLAREVASGERLPTVRVYGWNPPAISCGWHQSLDEIDREAAERAGIGVVRRPTGGRAILHSEELTYSVVSDLRGFENLSGMEGDSISSIYRIIGEALVCGLQHLGIRASLEKSQPYFPAFYRVTSGAACFSSSARHEIKVGGRKLVGSAQRRFSFGGKEVILQHGSILMGADHLRIADFLKLESEDSHDALKEELSMKTTDITSIIGSSIEVDDVATAVRRGFEERWNIEFESRTPHSTHAVHEL